VLILAPWIFGFSDVGGAAVTVPIVIGALMIGQSVITDWELSLADILPPRYHRGEGARLLAATRRQGLERVVAKRLDSRYAPGRRSGAWIKVRNTQRQEFIARSTAGGYPSPRSVRDGPSLPSG
jgi:hypothetical protein